MSHDQGETSVAAPADTTRRRGRRRPEGGVRLFASTSEEPRARRPTDVMLLVVDAFVLVVLVVATGATSAAEGELLNLAALAPGLLENVWEVLHDLAIVWAVGLLLLALLSHRRMRLFRDMLLATAGAFVISAVAYRFVQHAWPPLLGELTRSGGPPRFPALRLAVTSAVVITASPHLARPLRYAGRWVVAGAAVAAVVLQVSSPGGAVGALVIGSLSAVIVHLIFGSPGGRPSLHQVAAALQELGVDAFDLQAADLQPEGVWTVHGTGSAGEPLVIKVYGRDAWDSQLAMSVWRFVWYRNSMPTLSIHRIQQVEHEAFLILLAAGAGVAVPAVVAAGESAVGDALLVVRSDATPLDELAEVDDALLAELWSSLDRAHETGISPGQLDPRRMGRDPQGRGVLLDWVAGETAPRPDQVLQDDAQLLVSTALLVGDDRAIAAVVARGADRLSELLSFVQPASLSPTLRQLVHDQHHDVDALRARAAELAAVEVPDLVKLRRVTWGSILQAALLILAATAIVKGLTSLDLRSVATTIRDMSVPVLVVAFVLTQLARASGAMSTIGASPAPLPVGPVIQLQFAIGYINMAVPSTAGRMAMVMRFYQRVGSTATTALGVGALDGFANFFVQVVLIVVTLGFGLGTLDIQLADSVEGLGATLLHFVEIALVVLVVGAVVTLLFAPLRRRVMPTLQQFREGLDVLRSPKKVLLLVGGNFITQALYSLALGMCAQATGYHVGLVDLLLVINLVGTLSSLIPVPNGIGVCEAGLTAGLVACGVPETEAFAAAIVYRVLSSYLPPIWGFFAMRSLQKQHYL